MKVYQCIEEKTNCLTAEDPLMADKGSRHVKIASANDKSPRRKLIRQEEEIIPEDEVHLTNNANNYRRTSLHGKPLYLRYSRNDAKYRRLQSKLYNFLERPKTPKAISYHVFVFACVLSCLILNVLATMDSDEDKDNWAGNALFYLELFMLFWFFTEYCLRIWSAGCRSRYQTLKGRLLFAKRPFCLVDLAVILTSVVVLALGPEKQKFAASPVRGLRFFQILRMIRMDRKGGSWKLLFAVVWAHRQELFTTMYIGFLGLISCSFVMYLVEKEVNDKINSYADALWWGVITLCTVGYGDTVPKTWTGKILASFCAVLGISFFALPAGILGSGFALKVQQNQRQKHLIRRRVPAASLIQCLWRCYAADPDSTSVATWKMHLKTVKSQTGMSQKFGRFGTMKRRQALSSAQSPTLHQPISKTASFPRTVISSHEDFDNGNQLKSKNRLHFMGNSTSDFINRDDIKDDVDMQVDILVKNLTPIDKTLIRIIRKIRFFVARRKFKEALRPYDVKDVIEQYSAGHLDMLTRVKCLQTRLDQIIGPRGDKDEPPLPLGSRIILMENKINEIDFKMDLLIGLIKTDYRMAKNTEKLQIKEVTKGAPEDENSFELGSDDMIDTANSDPVSISNCSFTIAAPNLGLPSQRLKPEEDDPLLMSEEAKNLKKTFC